MSEEWTAEDYNNAIGMGPYDLDFLTGLVVDLAQRLVVAENHIREIRGE